MEDFLSNFYIYKLTTGETEDEESFKIYTQTKVVIRNKILFSEETVAKLPTIRKWYKKSVE